MPIIPIKELRQKKYEKEYDLTSKELKDILLKYIINQSSVLQEITDKEYNDTFLDGFSEMLDIILNKKLLKSLYEVDEDE